MTVCVCVCVNTVKQCEVHDVFSRVLGSLGPLSVFLLQHIFSIDDPNHDAYTHTHTAVGVASAAARSGWELLLGAREQRVAARGHGWARGRVLRSWWMQADAALRRLLPGAVLFLCCG